MTPEQQAAFDTRIIWNIFNDMTDCTLVILLQAAGIVTLNKTRAQVLNNCVVNWFHGSVPNFQELDRLTKE